LDSKLARGVNADTELKSLANGRGLDAGTKASPESCIQKNDVHGWLEDVGGQLLEIDHHGIGRQRHPEFLAHPSHSVQAENGIFQVIVVQVFNRSAELDGLLCRPHGVWVKPQPIPGQCGSERAIALQVVLRQKNSALQLVRGEAPSLLEFLCVRHELLNGANFSGPISGAGITEKEIGRKFIPDHKAATENLGGRNSPRLPQDVETREFKRRDDLRSIVVERSRWVTGKKS